MNPTNVTKTTRTGNGFKERLTVKRFPSADLAHGFLNAQSNNDWQIARPEHADKKAGVYAFAGGEWHNVKSLDASVLAHI